MEVLALDRSPGGFGETTTVALRALGLPLHETPRSLVKLQ
jgi:hypothetical protein